MNKIIFSKKSALTIACILCMTTNAYAESIVPLKKINVNAPTTTGTYYFTEKTSTATHLDLRVKDTPQSISVITSQLIKDAKLESITDVVKQTAGLSAKDIDSSRQKFTARGFEITNLQVDGAATSWTGGFRAGESQMDTVIYERIDVIRGATGLLTGTGNPSASINMIRKHADSEKFSGTVDLEVGSWEKRQATIDVGGALSKDGNIRARLIGRFLDKKSFRDLAEEKKQVLYGVIDADLTENTQLSIGASYQNNQPKGTTWAGLSSWYSDGSHTDWDRSKTVGTDWTRWNSTQTNYFANLKHYFKNGTKLDASYENTTRDAELRLLYVYGAVDKATGSGLKTKSNWQDTTHNMENIDLHITSPFTIAGNTHELTAGIMYNKQTLDAKKRKGSKGDPIANFYDWDGTYSEPTWAEKKDYSDHKTEQVGVYAATKLVLSDDMKLIIGGRISNWSTNGLPPKAKSKYKSNHDQVFTPYAGFLYDLNNNHTAYISYTSIFNPQNKRFENGDYLNPIEGDNYELGLKSQYLQGKVSTGISVFKIEQNNLAQADGSKIVTGTTTDQAYYEAKGATSQGFELELSGKLKEGWDMSASWSQFEAEDANDNKVNTSQPRKMAKLFTTYQLQGDLKNLMIGGGVQWESENYTETTKNPLKVKEKLKQEAYSIVNIMAKYQFRKDLTAQLNIKNLFDKKYYSQIGFKNQYAYGNPRNIELNVEYKF